MNGLIYFPTRLELFVKFKLAVIDPPWNWKAYSKKGDGKAPPYERMDDALYELDIKPILEKDAVVMLWVIDSMLPEAMELVKKWGLDFRTVGFYWTKERPSGAEHMGTGYYTRANPEQCWLLRQGRGIPRISASVRRWLHAPVGGHSAKPEAFYERLEALFGDVPRIDIFARATRAGWTTIGNEIDGKDIFDAITSLAEKE